MLVDSFLDYLRYERNYSDKTVEAYREDLSQFSDFACGAGADDNQKDDSLKGVTGELIREWIVSLMDEGLKPTSINRKLSAARSFYKFLLRGGFVSIDPLRKITSLKCSKRLPVFLKESEMNRAIDEVDFGDGFKGCRDRLIIEMFYATGLRRSELIGLNDADVNFERSVIKVTGKRNKQRQVPFDEELKQDILQYIALRDKDAPRQCDALFVREDGSRLTVGIVYSLVRKQLSKVTTQKKRSPHVLRHTFATAMLNNEAELNVIKELLGHESLGTTQVYAHTTFEKLKKTYKQAHPRA